jgi:hypothetical protein
MISSIFKSVRISYLNAYSDQETHTFGLVLSIYASIYCLCIYYARLLRALTASLLA